MRAPMRNGRYLCRFGALSPQLVYDRKQECLLQVSLAPFTCLPRQRLLGKRPVRRSSFGGAYEHCGGNASATRETISLRPIGYNDPAS